MTDKIGQVEWEMNNLAGLVAKMQTDLGVDPDAVLYKKYVALLTQTGTAAPVATVLENTLGEVPVWSRAEEGEYLLTTVASLFLVNKTWVTINGPQATLTHKTIIGRTSDTTVGVSTINTASADDVLMGTSLEIRVYP